MHDEAEELLAAGAVLPVDTDGAGELAVPLTARTYRHPVLDDRVVVRLVAADLGVGEDALAGFLGMAPVGEPPLVGLGLRQALGFPEWVLVHHPDDGPRALAVMPEVQRIVKQVKTKPKQAADDYRALADRLARAVPHFLPTFYEQAGRAFLVEDEDTFAAQMFNRARKAEKEHGLPVDLDRLDAAYVEFALAGALSASALAGYAKELAAQLPADEALDRLCALSVRSAAAGLVPSTQLANAIRRLVRAAAKAGGAADADARERAYLAELLGQPTVTQAAPGWWATHMPALVELCEQDPTVRGTLLNLMFAPDWYGHALAPWLEMLTTTGAVAGLVDVDAPEDRRPTDGSAGWLTRLLTAWARTYNPPRVPALYELVARMSPRLRAELAGSDRTLDWGDDLDLLDLLLANGVPVLDGDKRLRLDKWAQGEGQRDLRALLTDPRFAARFRTALDGLSGESGCQAIRWMTNLPSLRPLLTEWIRDAARSVPRSGLPHLSHAIAGLAWLPDEAVKLGAEEISAVAGLDLAEEAARSLRGGLLDELGWPAWEEARADVIDAKSRHKGVVVDAWPYLIVAGPTRARVIDADGTVLNHDLRIPPGDVWGEPAFHYVDGELLVYWDSRELGGHLRGYWHSSADAPQPIEGDRSRNQPRTGHVSLPMPGGGRAIGRGTLYVGDTAVPEELEVISDGTSYWAYGIRDKEEGYGWYAYNPVADEHGHRDLPAFLADAVRTAPEGSVLAEQPSWLRPAPTDRVTPMGAPVQGLLGWRVVRLPDGSTRGEDLAGRTVTVTERTPIGALTLPGDDRPRAVLDDLCVLAPDGITCAAAGGGVDHDYTPDAVPMPPRKYWHYLTARDPQGSAALRQIDRDTVATLLKSVDPEKLDKPDEPDELLALIRTMLPQIGHDAVVAGVAGVVRLAARRQRDLNALAERITTVLTGSATESVTGPTDEQLGAALNGLVQERHWAYRGRPEGAFVQLRLVDAARSAAVGEPSIRLHVEAPAMPRNHVYWPALLDHPAAVAYRAVAASTPDEHRDTLRTLLAELDRLGLATVAEPATWRMFELTLTEKDLTGADGRRLDISRQSILPLGGGAFLAALRSNWADPGVTYGVLYHDPSGEFAVPAPYRVTESRPVGEARPAGWLGAFFAEWAGRGPLPGQDAAADEFARLTGATITVAKLVLAGLPRRTNNWLEADERKAFGVKAPEAALARDTLDQVNPDVRAAVVAALLPADPARLWTDGPDVAAAAAVWNARVGRRVAVPEQILAAAAQAVRTNWGGDKALPALVEPKSSRELSNDLAWTASGGRADPNATGFTADVLIGAVATVAWTAHHTPAGDPVRATLPAALAVIRDRLANPELILDIDYYVRLDSFRKVAGAPAESGDGWERYGAFILDTNGNYPYPRLRLALLDDTGDDPYLPALRGTAQRPFLVESPLRMARDPRFAALLADPGDPVAGDRFADGTWWPQDPTRSVPELVAQVAARHGLGSDAAAAYLMLLAMPDPTDRNVATWTGWKRARLKAAHAELAGTDLVTQGVRTRAGRSLFLPGVWLAADAPLEQWKKPMFEPIDGAWTTLPVTVPLEPVADLYRRAWQRCLDGDDPRFEELQTPRGNRR